MFSPHPMLIVLHLRIPLLLLRCSSCDSLCKRQRKSLQRNQVNTPPFQSHCPTHAPHPPPQMQPTPRRHTRGHSVEFEASIQCLHIFGEEMNNHQKKKKQKPTMIFAPQLWGHPEGALLAFAHRRDCHVQSLNHMTHPELEGMRTTTRLCRFDELSLVVDVSNVQIIVYCNMWVRCKKRNKRKRVFDKDIEMKMNTNALKRLRSMWNDLAIQFPW